MKIALVVNPRSGRGRAPRLAADLEHRFEQLGHSVARVNIDDGANHDIAGALRGAAAAIVAGGDGTFHHVAAEASPIGVPVYHAPLGTENLIAREFAMSRDPAAIERAVINGRTAAADVASCNGRAFLIMCSIGPDASIIHRMHAARSGPITRLTYTPHVVAEALHPAFARVTVDADGRRIVDAKRGLLFVANSRHYAVRIDPVHTADMRDGLLDMVFLPCASSLGALAWVALARLRLHTRRRAAVCARARGFTVNIHEGSPCKVQIDGEAYEPNSRTLRFAVSPGALRVLLPAGNGANTP